MATTTDEVTAAEMILDGIAAIQREVDGDGAAAVAIDIGREAIGLLRRALANDGSDGLQMETATRALLKRARGI